MAVYEYKCRTCDSAFEVRRSMTESSSSPTCPSGHSDTVKLFSIFAATGRAQASGLTACGSPSPGSCGGGCSCH